MKVAQILSTIPDALPPEYVDELAALQADARQWVGCLSNAEWRLGWAQDWQEKYAQFDRQAISAASLGQVHKAISHDGAALAVKVAISRYGVSD